MRVDSAASDSPLGLSQPRDNPIFHCFVDLLVYLSHQYIVEFIQRIFREFVTYPIEEELISPATRVIFTRSKRTHQPICLKVWRRCSNELYDTEDVKRCTSYIVDGLEFNRQFAQNVYIGIAPVKLSERMVRRGRLIREPEKRRLKPGVEYALVMRHLEEDWQLDHLLSEGKLATKAHMAFLAKEVARIHKQLASSPKDIGNYDCILLKLDINIRLFNKALNQLDEGYVEKYGWINDLMDRACEAYRERFDQRYATGHIKRCHGDLKATNLWVRPEKSLFLGLKKYPPQLLALDCVDFNHPEFCHIDTLSDVAMLAIDIEARLKIQPAEDPQEQSCQGPAELFLNVYLQELKENSKISRPLLEYYMTEKAMICAYMSILYDNLPELGETYLEVALVHAQKLEQQLICPEIAELNEHPQRLPTPIETTLSD
jgi:aminoglycoside phosphotransferase family enzyme